METVRNYLVAMNVHHIAMTLVLERLASKLHGAVRHRPEFLYESISVDSAQ